ncbi:MAG TPA: nuclear transport factor 2 family protein [Pyrinomonadaceae bacterium]|nr:nuclear transport factor 2 family protein [Pyrinomonadaceae bacterium]
MKPMLCFLMIALVALVVMVAIAQKPTSESPLFSMVATERAFAKASEDKGTRESFMMFIAEDGILFRPTAVQGKKWMQEHPVPPSDKRPLLAWQPIFAEMAAAGDMGYTFGPWEFKQDIHDQKAVAFGHFATVWKKQEDGTWKFAIDLGIGHPQSAIPATRWEPSVVKAKTTVPDVPVATSRKSLLGRDYEFSQSSAKEGVVAAFTKYAAEDVRVFRNDHFPFVGKQAIPEALSGTKGTLTWDPAFADASRSGDLGYTYGTYEVKTDGALTAKGNYMRFWRKIDGAWRVVLDVADPLALEEKKSQ